MNQAKSGRFIAERRKNAGLTQLQLAEKLGITDRAVSKWETGRAMPDLSVMQELCGILGITVNDLLSGEVVSMDNYKRELENNLLDMIRQKEQADRRLLTAEVILCVACIIPLLAAVALVSLMPFSEGVEAAIVLVSLVPLLLATPFALKIEQKAGYYLCQKCGHRHVPKYGSVFFAMHLGRTRYMKCPCCGKSSWQKKVLSRE